jgi:hypothetical protein
MPGYLVNVLIKFQYDNRKHPHHTPSKYVKPPNEATLNGSILKVAAAIKNVVASAALSEVGACFQNAQSGAQSELPSLNWDTLSLRHH